MSSEEAQSDMQKFKGEALVRGIETRRKLLVQARGKPEIISMTLMVALVMVLLIVGRLYFKFLNAEDLTFSFLFCILVATGTAIRTVGQRIDALIELIGEENLLKKP